MIRKLTLPRLLLGAALPLLAGAACAQALPPIQESITRGAQIEEQVGQNAVATSRDRAGDEDIAGEAGVYVLKRQDIFYVSVRGGVGYSDNPLRTADDVGGSGSIEAALNAGVRTRLAGRVDFSAAVNLESTHYFKEFAPSNTAVTATANLGTPVAHTPFYVGATAFGGGNFDGDFSLSRGVAFYGVSGFVSGQFPIGRRILVQPAVSVTRQWTGVKENNNTSLGARVAATLSISGRLSANVSAGVSRVWFDNFFEDVTFVPRRDWQYDFGVSADWRLSRQVLIEASVRRVIRNSTFFLSRYRSTDGGVSVSAMKRF